MKKARRSNENGSILLLAICFMAIATIITGATVAIVNDSSTASFNYYNEKQAYYTASTCLDAFIEYVEDANYKGTALSALAEANTSGPVLIDGESDMDNLGNCNISVKYYNAEKTMLVVTATADVNGTQSSMSAYYAVKNKTVSKKLQNAIEASGGTLFKFSLQVVGDVTCNDGGTMDNQTTIIGCLRNEGNLVMGNNGGWIDKSVEGGETFLTTTGSLITQMNGEPKFQPITNPGYIAVGEKLILRQHAIFGTLDKDKKPTSLTMDLYAHGIYFGGFNKNEPLDKLFAASRGEFSGCNASNTVVNGNIYSFYKYNEDGSRDTMLNAMVCVGMASNTATLNVYGNVYAEGGFVSKSQNGVIINGDLHLGPDMKDKQLQILGTSKLQMNGNIYYDAKNMSSAEVSALLSHISTKVNFASGKSAVAGTFTQPVAYKSVKIEEETWNYASVEDIVTSDDAFNNGKYIGACGTGISSMSKNTSSVPLGKEIFGNNTEFYYVTQSCMADIDLDKKKILIDVDKADKDIVFVLPNNLNVQNKLDIIVKNDNEKHFCYIVTDEISKTSKIKPILKFSHTDIMSYYTWKQMVKGGKSLNTTAYVDDDDNYLNVLNNNSIFTPKQGRIFFMVANGGSVTIDNDSVLECTLYGPNAVLDAKAGGRQLALVTKLSQNITDPSGSTSNSITIQEKTNSIKIAYIGAGVFKDFTFSEQRGALYQCPADGNAVSKTAPKSDDKTTFFDHYEKR